VGSLVDGRSAIGLGVAAALLAGCSGSQAAIGTPGAIGQTSTLVEPSSSTKYHIIYSFSGGSDGASPEAGLIYVDGTLYGTTARGGASCGVSTSQHDGCGTVFSVTPTGTESVLHAFGANADGAFPYASLLDVGGTFYGTTYGGGGPGTYHCSGTRSYYGGCGTVFSVTQSGTETVLYSFQGFTGGGQPQAPLIAVKGTLYGTTTIGGGSDCAFRSGSCGTAFTITTAGAEKPLHYFGGGKDGASPCAGLTQVDGMLYGTTPFGGSARKGTVFSITMAGSEKVLHDFAGQDDGRSPYGGLLDVKGTLYGTTASGGEYNHGTVFSIKPGGAEKVLHSFGNGSDGSGPRASLIDVNGKLYGTTSNGGAHTSGTVFSIALDGTEKVLYSFDGDDGSSPDADLVDVNGTLYGTTSAGGAHGLGTVFSLKS
jgi:uncharacterized repeat protein (TIGR03803 family)